MVVAAQTDLPLQALANKATTIAKCLSEVSACARIDTSQDEDAGMRRMVEADSTEYASRA